MAAGLSSRFAPLSYEKPKGVLTVRGEVLIERQIRQLQEAGITDITVVVGYMKEAFFYLEDKFGVTIRVNAEYSVRNNNSTLMLVREKLGNTYVCSSDDYFTENVFEPYVFEAYYPGVFFAARRTSTCSTPRATAHHGRDHRRSRQVRHARARVLRPRVLRDFREDPRRRVRSARDRGQAVGGYLPCAPRRAAHGHAAL